MRGTKLKIVILMFICAIAALYASCVKKETVYTDKDFFNAIRQNKIEIVKNCLAQGMSVDTSARIKLVHK